MPYRTIAVKAPLFMSHKGVRVYRVYRRDDADSGVLRQYVYTLDPVGGSDDQVDGQVTFDVCDLSRWREMPHPDYVGHGGYVPADRRARRKRKADRDQEDAIRSAIRAAIDKGEIGPRKTVACSLCGNPCDAGKAHLHQGKWIGDECCWDERLRASE